MAKVAKELTKAQQIKLELAEAKAALKAAREEAKAAKPPRKIKAIDDGVKWYTSDSYITAPVGASLDDRFINGFDDISKKQKDDMYERLMNKLNATVVSPSKAVEVATKKKPGKVGRPKKAATAAVKEDTVPKKRGRKPKAK